MGFLHWPNTQALMRGKISRTVMHECHKEFAAWHGASVDLVARYFMCTEKKMFSASLILADSPIKQVLQI